MRAVRVKVIGPEKRVRPRQKQRETVFLLKSVSLKMSESEHFDSEFYYPVSSRTPNALITYSQRSNRKKVTTLETTRGNAAARCLFPPKIENEEKVVI